MPASFALQPPPRQQLTSFLSHGAVNAPAQYNDGQWAAESATSILINAYAAYKASLSVRARRMHVAQTYLWPCEAGTTSMHTAHAQLFVCISSQATARPARFRHHVSLSSAPIRVLLI